MFIIIRRTPGAWIEIQIKNPGIMIQDQSHSSRVRGLKQTLKGPSARYKQKSHSSRVRGLKLPLNDAFMVDKIFVAPFTGAWIRNVCYAPFKIFACRHPRNGAWIEIQPKIDGSDRFLLSHPTGAWIETSFPPVRNHFSVAPARVRGLKLFIPRLVTRKD